MGLLGGAKKEHRVHTRVRPRSDQPIQVQVMGDGFIEMLRARNISVGGLAIQVPHHFDGCDTRSEVQLVVKLPGEKAFTTRGFIRHIHIKSDSDGLYGIEFSQLPPDALARVTAYVARRVHEGGTC